MDAQEKPDAEGRALNKLAPYIALGMDLDPYRSGKEAIGDCPFCGSAGKFSCNKESGQWRCFICAEGSNKGGGNVFTFINRLWEMSDEATQDYSELQENRGFIYTDTLMAWGAAKSIITDEWIIPGRNIQGAIATLYIYRWNEQANGGQGKFLLQATTGLNQHLFGLDLFDPAKEHVFVCEGPWDAMVLWETLKWAKREEADGKHIYSLTASSSTNLLAHANVIAVPGCNIFNQDWTELFKDKIVYFLYDSDYQRAHPKTGAMINGGAITGMERATGMLCKADDPPEEIHFINWGLNGFDPEQPHGYDIRDLLSSEDTLVGRVGLLGHLFDKIAPVPGEWLGRAEETEGKLRSKDDSITCLPCEEYKLVINAFRKALHWTAGLDKALSVMLSAVTSTKAVGDQLWVKVTSPPSSGKSVLCEALSVNRKYISPKSCFTGMYSGWKTDVEGKEDHSLVAQLKDKTMIIKDGDTLMKAKNKEQTLSQLRDLYDRVSRVTYGNDINRDYEGYCITIILCGTSSLTEMDRSELGERFLTCNIMDSVPDDLEQEIAERVAHRAFRELNLEVDGRVESRDGPEMVLAKRLTGGYVSYLRKNAQRLLEEVEGTDEALRFCTRLALFVAILRARPSEKQDEKVEREVSWRLTSQLVRLAKCMAVVLNKKSLDADVMKRVHLVALDTAKGKVLDLCKYLYRHHKDGVQVGSLNIWTGDSADKIRDILRFLAKIKAAEAFHKNLIGGAKSPPKWRLSKRLYELFKEIVANAPTLE